MIFIPSLTLLGLASWVSADKSGEGVYSCFCKLRVLKFGTQSKIGDDIVVNFFYTIFFQYECKTED